MSYRIIKYPDPILKEFCYPIDLVRNTKEDTINLAKKIIDLMEQNNGVGLAAPQIGANIRLFVAKIPTKTSEYTIFINPTIKKSHILMDSEEGCLSIDSFKATLKRSKFIKISYHDENFIKHKDIFYRDKDAIIIQHEIDHLNGVLINDKRK